MNELTKAGLVVGGVGLVVFIVYKTIPKVGQAVGGLVTGNNVITQNQTNASGQATDAYQGAGILGTLGGVFNSASGGLFASAGEWIGGKLADLTEPAPTSSSTPVYTKPPVGTNGSYDTSDSTPLSFYDGWSFKDLSDPRGVNPFGFSGGASGSW